MVIAVDFDGTLCEHCYPEIGQPHVDLIQSLIEARKRGHKLILWTCREDEYLANAVEWCHRQGLDFDAVNQNLVENIIACRADPRKIFADAYVDDRAVIPTSENIMDMVAAASSLGFLGNK